MDTNICIIILNAFVSILVSVIAFFVSSLLIIKYQNSKKQFKWKFNSKLESTFLFVDFTPEEKENKKIIGDELKVIENFYKHFIFFQNLVLEMGFLNSKLAKKIQEDFLNGILRPFLREWEKYNTSASKVKSLPEEEKEKFFNDLLKLKKDVKEFYYKVNKNDKKKSVH